MGYTRITVQYHCLSVCCWYDTLMEIQLIFSLFLKTDLMKATCLKTWILWRTTCSWLTTSSSAGKRTRSLHGHPSRSGHPRFLCRSCHLLRFAVPHPAARSMSRWTRSHTAMSVLRSGRPTESRRLWPTMPIHPQSLRLGVGQALQTAPWYQVLAQRHPQQHPA